MGMKKQDQNTFDIQLGVIVRKLREERKLSRPTLSEISGVNEKYLGKIERGECSPSLFIINKISRSLNLKLSEIFYDL
jgi:DNA-binding XRE family transcriptional regulator